MPMISWLGRLAAGLLLGASVVVHAGNFDGMVTHVSDGDTLWVRPASGGAPRAVRLEGIDAPEICQAHGARSRDALAARVLHQRVKVSSRRRDDYERELAHVSKDGEDLGRWLVSHGHAWSYRFRKDPGPYAMQEAQARSARLGLWGTDAPMPPREFRKANGSCR